VAGVELGAAVGGLDVLLRARIRVPEDVSVVGYDDSRLARLSHVDMTTVDQDAPAQARGAVQAAIETPRRRPRRSRRVVLPPRLVARSTTAAPRS